MSTLITPLRELLKKKCRYWTEAHTEVINKLKKIVNGSQTGLGCCLLQGNRPIAFPSRSLDETEERYPQIEKEMLSILYACKKINNYIYGNTTKVMTDHSPLVQIFQKNFNKVISVRLQKMKMKLIIYDLGMCRVFARKIYVYSGSTV